MNKLSACELEIIRRVRATREAHGLSQEAVGQALGLTKYGYGHYEREDQPFTVEQLFRLSGALGRSIEWFLGLETDLGPQEDEIVTTFRQIESEPLRDQALEAVRGFATTDRRIREES